jgi:hypothetical protein
VRGEGSLARGPTSPLVSGSAFAPAHPGSAFALLILARTGRDVRVLPPIERFVIWAAEMQLELQKLP